MAAPVLPAVTKPAARPSRTSRSRRGSTIALGANRIPLVVHGDDSWRDYVTAAAGAGKARQFGRSRGSGPTRSRARRDARRLQRASISASALVGPIASSAITVGMEEELGLFLRPQQFRAL